MGSNNLLEFMDGFIYDCYNEYSVGCVNCKFIYALDINNNDNDIRCISLFLKDLLENLNIIHINHGDN